MRLAKNHQIFEGIYGWTNPPQCVHGHSPSPSSKKEPLSVRPRILPDIYTPTASTSILRSVNLCNKTPTSPVSICFILTILTLLPMGHTLVSLAYCFFRLAAFRQIQGCTALFRVFPTRKCSTKARVTPSLICSVALNGKKDSHAQQRHGPLFFSAGLEAEIRHGAKSKAKVNGHKKNLDSGLNVHPVGINLLAQAGYGDQNHSLQMHRY